MKIGIITYHFARNYGAILQCYALQNYLTNNNNEVTVINYVEENQKKNNSIFNRKRGFMNLLDIITLLPLAFFRIRKEKKFQKFLKEKIHCSYEINNIEELENFLEEENFDYVISGSDQVWNPYIKDFSKAFFLPFNIKSKKVTYAASIGNAKLENLIEYKDYINDFRYISLREEKSKEIIEKITDKEISVVNDPVTLLEKEEWSNLCENIEKKKYLLCYFLHKNYLNEEYKIAKKIAQNKNLKLIMINANFSLKSFYLNCIKDVGPIDFLSLFKNAEYICTDSFHGTMFSVIFEKNFNVFTSYKEKQDSRRENVLKSTGLMARLVYVENGANNIDVSNIDYQEINPEFNNNIKYSKEFIKKISHN